MTQPIHRKSLIGYSRVQHIQRTAHGQLILIPTKTHGEFLICHVMCISLISFTWVFVLTLNSLKMEYTTTIC